MTGKDLKGIRGSPSYKDFSLPAQVAETAEITGPGSNRQKDIFL
jgi:hypothetical protein